ncbi:MAG: SDR family oxidoreductase [Pseudomonadales bacterium]|jgi:NAD(P)-dependent dehydrogenase (short-subunit alcohol dehydrogenase family)|nr:SDR family oxidoreductase [Pseudomonadales bacterium]MDP6471015.1 SDR family oxidoreductase [Pseudomonadales bacterium]MDP6825799.1 SDR family oxidoreductase [Pseudomonadales bacterium]MDP6970207.1 SDR family oxidoreductase [Pseudomonadales bacterium]
MGMLDGKVALVTGAGGGIGRAHSLLLAKEGASVVVNDLGGSRDGTGSGSSMADGVVEEINAAGGKAIAHYGSVTSKDDAQGMVDAAVAAFGRIDICICNAGILRDKSFKNMDDDMWDIVLDVHLRGTYLVSKAAYDRMLEQGEGGRIIMTSSTSGLLGNFGQTNYGAAKAGIAGFMRCLWLEGLKYGITVNVLAPTATSRMTTDILPEDVQDQFPPETISPTIVWLCTDEAKDVSGRQWLVAGNNVSLLSWQVTPIASRDLAEGPWDVAEVGERILASKDNWPAINPLRG